MRRALVRPPSPRLADGLVTHIGRTEIDVELAGRQWQAYVAALQAEGWETIEVEPADDCPDSVFVEDTVVVYGDLAVISRPGADERKPETSEIYDAPVVTMTSSWTADEISYNPPVTAYLVTMGRGLAEGQGWGREQVTAYLMERPGIGQSWDGDSVRAVLAG